MMLLFNLRNSILNLNNWSEESIREEGGLQSLDENYKMAVIGVEVVLQSGGDISSDLFLVSLQLGLDFSYSL